MAGRNCFEDDAAQFVADMLEHTAGLAKLVISTCCNDFVGENDFGSTGASAILRALKKNWTLRSLNIANNKLGAECGPVLAEALAANRGLKTLNLGIVLDNFGGRICGDRQRWCEGHWRGTQG